MRDEDDYFGSLPVEEQLEHMQEVGMLEGQLTSVYGGEMMQDWRRTFAKRDLVKLVAAGGEMLDRADKLTANLAKMEEEGRTASCGCLRWRCSQPIG